MDRLVIFTLCLASLFAVNDAKNVAIESKNGGKAPLKDEIGRNTNIPALETSNKEIMEIANLCNTTFPIPSAYLTELNETGRLPESATRDSKCYLFCVLSRLKVIDRNGNVNSSNFEKLFTMEEDDFPMSDSYKKCLTEDNTKKDACEIAYERISCLRREEMDYYSKKSDNK